MARGTSSIVGAAAAVVIAASAFACNSITGASDLQIGAGGGDTSGGHGGATNAGATSANQASATAAEGTTVATNAATTGVSTAASTSAASTSTSTSTAATATAASSTNAASSSTAAASTATASTAASTSASTGSGMTGDPSQDCVDIINSYRATLNLPPYSRVQSEESCVGMQAEKDYQANTPHSAFQQCNEYAQNECPGWPATPDQNIGGCLAMMWAEGPGSDFETHGHYINMSSTMYTKVSCGFYVLGDGSWWGAQDFYP